MLGDFPTLPPSDSGDEAYQRSRDKAIIRIIPLDLAEDDEDFDSKLTDAIAAECDDGSPEWKGEPSPS